MSRGVRDSNQKNSVGEYGMDISWNNTITILGDMFQAVLGCSIFWV